MPTQDLEPLLRQRLAALDLEQKVRLLTGRDGWSLHDMPEIGLASLVTSDGPNGVRGTLWDERDPSLNVPNATSLAATWDADLVERVARLIGAEARRKGVHVLLAPTVGLHRSPLGGRNFEAWSEDPYLTARLATAYVGGVQSQGVAATAKHYVLNDSETQRRWYDAQVEEDVLRELYLRPFHDLVRAGVWVVMAAYNRTSGTLLTEHRRLLWDVLKQEWGFDGVVVSDWHAVRSTVASACAGLDLEMPGDTGMRWGSALVEAVRRGEVDEPMIDDKVLRLLRLAARTGALRDVGDPLPEPADLTDAATTLREAAARGTVLLRNTGVLPLAEDTTVALIGELAEHVTTQGGGASHVEPVYVVQPLDAMRTQLGDRLTYEPGPAVGRTLWPLPLELTRDPETGTAGFHLEIFDTDGRLLRAEHRPATTFTFHSTLPPGTARLRWTTDLQVAEAGTHTLAFTGRGRTRVSVDGTPIADLDLQPRIDDDVQAIVRPAEVRVPVALQANAPVRLVIDTEPELAAEGRIGRFGVGYAPPGPDDDERLRRAVRAARDADVAVVLVGATDEHEAEGFDRDSLGLPGRQDELVSAVAEANPNTVVVLNAGTVYTMPWADEVAAILWVGMPGQEAGAALTSVLTGALEPWGRLPTTIPPAEGDAPVPSVTPVDGVLPYAEGRDIGYRAYEATGATPLFPFGHGLGYTTWELEAAELSGDGAVVTVTVRNTGSRAGRDVVQVYFRPETGTSRLVGFAAATAGPGERVTVTVELDTCAASRWDVERNAWAPLTSGELLVGRSVTDITHRIPVNRALGRR